MLFLLLGLLSACPFLRAQISKGGKPYSFAANLRQTINTKTVPALSLENLRKEDALHEKQGLPLRIGVILPVSYSLSNAGTWTDLPNGDRLWRLKIDAQGALATSLYYKDFHLPEGATLFVYNANQTQLIGSFTSDNNQETGLFATEILKGNVSVIEYYEPLAVKGQGRFTISGVNNIYSDKIPETKTVGASGSCNVNVNCPEGANWQNQKRAVARIVLRLGGSSYLCTGALVNNAGSDCKPYFLTANHCGSDASVSDFNQWIFYFNYEAPSCTNPSGEPASNTITGCVQRARSGDDGEAGGSDFQLLEFNQAIPSSYNVYYSGWSAVDVASPSGVSIHHPAGDIKKISTYTTPLTNGNFNGGSAATHWRANWVQTQTNWGITEGGSSGSPLFNSAGQIVGQLSGGPSSCTASSANKNDLYGKMSYNWTSNATDVLHQLKPWLDPNNTGILQLNGTNAPCGDTTGPTVCPDPYEPNNTLATAYTTTSGTNIRAIISTSSDTDYFRIVVPDTSRIYVILDNLAANFNLRLLASNGALLASSQNASTYADSILYTGTGTFYIQVYGNAGASYDSICYRLNTTITAIGGCQDQMEPNNTLATAAGISTGTNIRSQISTTSDVDYYSFTTTGTNTITIRLDSLPADYDVRLFSSTGSQLGLSQNGDTNAELITYNLATAGTYYVQVFGYNGAFNATRCYRLSATLTPVATCSDAYEPNATQAAAAAIPVNTAINAQIASATDTDWYKFSNTSSQPHIEILLSNLAGDYDVFLYDSVGTELGSSENSDTANERIVLNNAAVRTYYIRIIGYNGAFSTTKCYRLVAGISSTPKQGGVNKSSKVVTNSSIRVYPVPARDKVYTEISSPANKLQYIIVTDMSGKVVYKQQHRLVAGFNRLEVLLPVSLKDGVYIISNGSHSQKFVLQR